MLLTEHVYCRYVQDSEAINNVVIDFIEHRFIALKATYGMGKTFGGLTPTVEYFKQMGLSQIAITDKVSLCYKLTIFFLIYHI